MTDARPRPSGILEAAVFPSALPPRARIFCCPHAGGGPSAFHAWRAHLPRDVELAVLLLPGRETRYKESPFTRFDEVLDSAQRAIDSLADLPTVLVGHSLGALLAFELAQARRGRAGANPIVGLIAACMRAPSIPYTGRPVSTLSQAQLLQRISRLGGTPGDVLGNTALMEAMLPTIRADYAVHDHYVYRERSPVDLPLILVVAEDDALINAHLMAPWKELTTGPARSLTIPGDHFAIHDHRQVVIDEAIRMIAGRADAPGRRISPALSTLSNA